jgi:hypothetical protein
MPSKDLLPGLHQMIATAFLKNHMPLGRYQMAEHFQTGVNLTRDRVGIMFLPSSAKDFVPGIPSVGQLSVGEYSADSSTAALSTLIKPNTSVGDFSASLAR